MVTQTVLSIKLDKTRDTITPHVGAIILKVAVWLFALFGKIRTRCREWAWFFPPAVT
jgi:hypothetical protein